MSRKRKANKKRQGGRVTPSTSKKPVTRPGAGFAPFGLGDEELSSGWPANAAAPGPQPEARDVFSAMAGAIGSLRGGHPADVEQLASEFVAILAIAASEQGDEPADGSPSAADRARALEMLGVAARLLAEAEAQRARPHADYLDCLRALDPFLDDAARVAARSAAERAGDRAPVPQWADAIWSGQPIGAWRAGDLLGDSVNLGVELDWPGGWERRVLWGSLIITEGPFVNDLVVATLDEFTEVYTPGTGHPAGPDGRPYLADVIRFLDEADLAATLRDLKLGLLVASEHADVPVQPGHDSLAPLAGLLLNRLPVAGPEEPSSTSEAERDELVSSFLNSPEGSVLNGVAPVEVRERCEPLFDYVEQRSDGDVHRWSPAVAAAFLDWYHQRTTSSDDAPDDGAEHDRFRQVVEAWIRYCHRLKGWPESVTVEALARLDAHVQPGIDPAKVWGQALSDGLEHLAEEFGGNLGFGDEVGDANESGTRPADGSSE